MALSGRTASPALPPAFFRWGGLIACLCALLSAAPVQAVEVEGLTRFSSLVSSRDAQNQARLARRGLGEVIIRLSGSSGVLSEPAVMDALERAETYLVQSRYESTRFTLKDEAGNEVLADRLVLTFSQADLEGLLSGAGLPVWGKDRPAVVAWVVVESAGREEWVSGEDEEAGAWLVAQAKRRGLPLQFPLFDLTDQMAISAGSLRQKRAEDLISASRRYGADHAIAGIITPTAEGYRARWQLLVRGESFAIDASGDSLDAVTGRAMGELADRMAARYAVRPTGGGADTRIRLTVENVRSLNEYARLNAALVKMSPVERAVLAEVRAETLVFLLDVKGSARQFVDLLDLNRNLRHAFDPELDKSGVWRLFYRYAP